MLEEFPSKTYFKIIHNPKRLNEYSTTYQNFLLQRSQWKYLRCIEPSRSIFPYLSESNRTYSVTTIVMTLSLASVFCFYLSFCIIFNINITPIFIIYLLSRTHMSVNQIESWIHTSDIDYKVMLVLTTIPFTIWLSFKWVALKLYLHNGTYGGNQIICYGCSKLSQ